MEYSKKTLEYYEKMKNIGEFDENLPNVGIGIVGSPLCGDVMKLQLYFNENDVIFDAKYKVFGCVSAIASMELVTTRLKGMSIEDALKIKNAEVADSLELTEIKRHCSVLAKEAIEAAVNNYLSKKNKENKMIKITPKAIQRLKELLKEHGGIGINISVLSGGCSGIDYALGYQKDADKTKSIVEISGLVFFYDPKIELLIDGVEIDLVENSFGQGFSVINKKHTGCANCTCCQK